MQGHYGHTQRRNTQVYDGSQHSTCLIKEIDIEIKGERAYDLDSHVSLPTECALHQQHSCTDGTVAYELLNKNHLCTAPFTLVSAINTNC